jgi:hypothetical protein
MSDNCELLDSCGFFKKYRNTKESACLGFISQYCNGPKMNQCERKKYREANGTPPPDDMMPNGYTIVASKSKA